VTPLLKPWQFMLLTLNQAAGIWCCDLAEVRDLWFRYHHAFVVMHMSEKSSDSKAGVVGELGRLTQPANSRSRRSSGRPFIAPSVALNRRASAPIVRPSSLQAVQIAFVSLDRFFRQHAIPKGKQSCVQ
jgi:hypothetical protein